MPSTVSVGVLLFCLIGLQLHFGLSFVLMAVIFVSFAIDWCDLPLFEALFLPGMCTSGFFCSMPTTQILGLLLDFNKSS